MGFSQKTSWFWKKNQYKKTTVTIACLVVGGLLFYGAWHFLNSPAKGTIKLTPATPQSRQLLPEYESLNNDYFKLNYSGKYSSVPVTATASEIVRYSLQETPKDPSEKPKGSLSIVLRHAPPGGITLDNDYQKYFKQRKDYKFSNKYFHGEAIDLAVKQNGGTDQVALWLHGPYVLAINLTKNQTNKDLDNELKDILTSVQWQIN